MPTRASSSAIDVIQDAKQLVIRAKKELPAIIKADKARGKTAGTNMDVVTTLAADIAAFEGATTAQRGKAVAAKAKTGVEATARAALALELKSIRDDVTDAAPKDVALQKAFGRGQKLDSNTTKTLLDAASIVAGSFTTRASDVKGAGVNKPRIAKLAKLRQALADADAVQRGAIADKGSATGGKSAVLARIQTAAAQLRRRLGSKAPVKSTSARRTVKKRTPKAPPTPPTT